MSLIIDLTPTEEERLSAAAGRTGLAPAEWAKKILAEHWPAAKANGDGETRLRTREDAGSKPVNTTLALFAKWAEEDANLSDEQREENDRIFAEIEKNGIPRVQI